MIYDVVVAGGGPAGLAATLTLARGRKRVLLCDAGAPRNARAEEVHNFVTRDGTPPAEFRRVAREQLARYGAVEAREARIAGVTGERGRFSVTLAGGASDEPITIDARRLLLCLGMRDVLPDLPGYDELWGKAIFQCPYCHGWEVQDRAWGCVATTAAEAEWSLLLRGWTNDLVVFTDRRFEMPGDLRAQLETASVRLEEQAITRLVPVPNAGAPSEHLKAVELEDGTLLPRDVLFARPPQRQTDLVDHLHLALDEHGFVRVDERMETSWSGIYAAGDMTTMMQAASLAAAAGTRAAAALNHELTHELALARTLA